MAQTRTVLVRSADPALFFPHLRGAAGLNVDVHVPETRDEVGAVSVKDAALRGSGGGVGRGHGNDAIALEDHGLIGQFLAGGDVDDRDMSDGCGVRGGILGRVQGGRESQSHGKKNTAREHSGLETQKKGHPFQVPEPDRSSFVKDQLAPRKALCRIPKQTDRTRVYDMRGLGLTPCGRERSGRPRGSRR
jgi:hypothetical protein